MYLSCLWLSKNYLIAGGANLIRTTQWLRVPANEFFFHFSFFFSFFFLKCHSFDLNWLI